MPHTTIRPDGRTTYRTSLFASLPRAQSFSRCLRANDRFSDILLHTSERSRTPKWFVTFLPANDGRQDMLHQAQQDARTQRAMQQGFLFTADLDSPGLFWCFSCSSGETYATSLRACSCPDHEFRCSRSGLHCKHSIALGMQLAAGTLDAETRIAA